MMNILIFTCVFFSCLMLSAENEVFISPRMETLTQNNNKFAFKLYRRLDLEGNSFLSPYSISSALSMVYDGAQGETKKEMKEVLEFDQAGSALNESFSMLNQFFEKAADETQDSRLLIFNALWIQKNFNILPQFLEDMAKYFKTPVYRADFLRQKETAREDINDLVKEKTMGKIENLVSASDIDNSTKMILISAIYMKAKWKNVFDVNKSKVAPFFINEANKMDTTFMNQSGFFPFYQSELFSALQLDYAFKPNMPELKFLIVLPRETFGLNRVEEKMDAENFKKIISSLESKEVDIFLPKFTFTKSFSLKNVLMQMGLKEAFLASANFEGMTGLKNLEMGQVLHKAFISVNEAGTEAAAASAATMNMKAILQKKEPILFRADHPFMFIIYEKETGSILFLGRVQHP